MKIISGPSSQELAFRVSSILNKKISLIEYSKFPDFESYFNINDEINGEEVLIIQSTVQDSDFINLLQLIDACNVAKKIAVVIPYMGYSRQDKSKVIGEPITQRALARSINCDELYTINIHNPSVLDYFTSKCKNLDSAEIISTYIKSLKLNDFCLVAPDLGSLNFVEKISTDLKCKYYFFEKTRISGTSISIKNKKFDIKNNNVIIVDDIISTGETVVGISQILQKNRNFESIYSICIHPVYSRNAVTKLYSSGIKKLIATDTIEKIQSKITVAPLISNEFKTNI